MRLPNFVVVGAPKCGTTSLHYYLAQHPDVYVPRRKELHYFTAANIQKLSAGANKHILASLCTTRQKYEAHFKGVGSQRAIGDVSPTYFYFAEVSERIRAELGRPKIVVVLRDPIEKTFSQYMHLVRDNRETLEFYDALMAEERRIQEDWALLWRYAESSLYAERLKKFLQVFGEEQVKILLFEDLLKSPHLVMQELFQFLGVDTSFRPDTSTIYNRSGRPKSKLLMNLLAPNIMTTAIRRICPESIRIKFHPLVFALINLNTGEKGSIDAKSRAYLQEYFRRDVDEVEKIVGKKLRWLQ